MSYARDLIINDADSHLMELPDFLSRNAPRATRERLPNLDDIGDSIEDVRVENHHDSNQLKHLHALGDNLLKGPKWHAALGAFNGPDRVDALDMLGFRRQVVFSSFCAGKLFAHPDPDIRHIGCAAHNRSMADFCDADPRLIGVGLATLEEPADALATIDAAQELGIGAIWIPAAAPGGRSPGHRDHDPIWARLEELGMPFILHVGSSPLQIADEWMNDGHSDRQSARGRAEVIGSKDLMVIYQPIERFLATLILDGVLERFPALRGAAIEVGAGWLPAMSRRLDHAVDIWARSEPHLAEMNRRPSEQIEAQLRFTPYPFEDVGSLINESSDRLFMFSSDYPHAEGGRDPLGRFQRALSSSSHDAQQQFLSGNFLTLFPG